MRAEDFVMQAWRAVQEDLHIWEDPRSIPPLETLRDITLAVRAALCCAEVPQGDRWLQLELW